MLDPMIIYISNKIRPPLFGGLNCFRDFVLYNQDILLSESNGFISDDYFNMIDITLLKENL